MPATRRGELDLAGPGRSVSDFLCHLVQRILQRLRVGHPGLLGFPAGPRAGFRDGVGQDVRAGLRLLHHGELPPVGELPQWTRPVSTHSSRPAATSIAQRLRGCTTQAAMVAAAKKIAAMISRVPCSPLTVIVVARSMTVLLSGHAAMSPATRLGGLFTSPY